MECYGCRLGLDVWRHVLLRHHHYLCSLPRCLHHTLHTLHHLLPVNTEDPSNAHRTMNNDDVLSSMVHSNMLQVPAGPPHENHSIVNCQQTNIYSHIRAKSDSYFSLQMSPRILDTPPFSVRSTGSASPQLPALPPVPPSFYLTTVQAQMPVESSSEQQDEEVKTSLECVKPSPEAPPHMTSGFTETVGEEHLYACIYNLRESEPSSPAPCDGANEDQCEVESPYLTVTYDEWTDSTACGLTMLGTDSEKEEELKFIFPLPAVHDDLPSVNPDTSPIYAVVNRKIKSPKLLQEAPIVQNSTVLDEDEAPPVPEKIFD
ncbi:uncharacterized protein LOC124376546 isoform X2 [Silurus meridionalis]|uniref:uncharacterized protein LOC124376546 isoform X2 n=1 Tax=Silurus meridionalis TaxID=175797 RepID=UPI001EEA7431|nr:uncharacterized protein LOC124376546 isoform X2 [Silurus meridionalis]